jgi:predicted transcriptional regulator
VYNAVVDEKDLKTETRTVRLEKHLLERLEAIATQDDRTISYVLRKAVEEYVEKREGTKKK